MARFPVVLCLSVLSTLLLSACGAEEDSRRQEELRSLMAAGNLPGLQVARVEDGTVVEDFALGVVEAEGEVPITASTVFEAASLSKPVTAYVAFRLVDRGELDLDTPLWEILEYPRLAHDGRARTITPRMVLSHTTGLPNWGGTPLELIEEPGEAWGYSGEGFVYLQRAMEKLTGRSLQELPRPRCSAPLGWRKRVSCGGIPSTPSRPRATMFSEGRSRVFADLTERTPLPASTPRPGITDGSWPPSSEARGSPKPPRLQCHNRHRMPTPADPTRLCLMWRGASVGESRRVTVDDPYGTGGTTESSGRLSWVTRTQETGWSTSPTRKPGCRWPKTF